MSKDQARQFTIDVFSNKELAEKFLPADSPEEIRAVIETAGYAFTPQELEEALTTPEGKDAIKVKLSDSMLEDVSGGGLWSGYKKLSRGVCTRIISFVKGVPPEKAREMIDEAFEKGVEDKVPQEIKDVLDGLEEIVPIFK